MAVQKASSATGALGEQFFAGPPQEKLAPEGLEPAAPNLLEQDWTGERGEASREPRPARPREPHAVGSVGALIFDMDGTMIDSMPWHAKAWIEFTRRHGIEMDMADMLRRTTGRTGAECMNELFQRDIDRSEAWTLVAEKELIYRELFTPVFAEVAGFKAFARLAAAQGLKLGVGTAGDKHNIAFAMARLDMQPAPHAIVGGDEGLPGKPEPAIFLEAARRMGISAAACIVFEDAPFGIEAARRAGMRAVAVCTSHSPEELSGPHVIASVRDYNELTNNNFLRNLHAATA